MLAGLSALGALASACAAPATLPTPETAPPPMAELLAGSPDADWRSIDPERTLYLELPAARVVIELAPAFAPAHVADIARLARGGFFDGAAVVRVQDNYVAGTARGRRESRGRAPAGYPGRVRPRGHRPSVHGAARSGHVCARGRLLGRLPGRA
jgi:peptidylprolyl isomerase